MSKLLFDESPLVVQPTLAKAIGLNEAIVLQQINYWMNQRAGKIINGERWIYNTVKEWKDQFPFWSEATIARTLDNLVWSGLVKTGNYNKSAMDRTKWYTIDFSVVELLDALIEQEQSMKNASSQNDQMEDGNLTKCNQSECANIPESTTENTAVETAAAIEKNNPQPNAEESPVSPLAIEFGEESPAEKQIAQVIFGLGWREREEIREYAEKDVGLVSLAETLPQFCEKVSRGEYKASWRVLKKFWANTLSTNRLKVPPVTEIPHYQRNVKWEEL